MSTLSNTTLRPTGFAFPLATQTWRATLKRWVAAWRARREARDRDSIDHYFRRERSEHERFLSRATDRYELERMEHDWARRSADLWRVY